MKKIIKNIDTYNEMNQTDSDSLFPLIFSW